MRFMLILENILPCRRNKKKMTPAEQQVKHATRRAREATVIAARRIGSVRIIIEAADDIDDFFNSDRSRR